MTERMGEVLAVGAAVAVEQGEETEDWEEVALRPGMEGAALLLPLPLAQPLPLEVPLPPPLPLRTALPVAVPEKSELRVPLAGEALLTLLPLLLKLG